MKRYQFISVLFFLLVLSCGKQEAEQNSSSNTTSNTTSTAPVVTEQTILFLNSYHEGYEWSDGIETGVTTVLQEHPHINLVFHRMDTKRNTSPEFISESAQRARTVIDSLKPDLVITSDDNAVKYVITPYYTDSSLPFVFTGVNGGGTHAGLSYNNVTGMMEVQLIDQIVNTMSTYSDGDRIGFIKGLEEAIIREADFFEEQYDISLNRKLVTDFEEWKREYRNLQTEVDMILLGNSAAIANWDSTEALHFIDSITTIPTGNWDSWMAPYSLITYATNPLEQGEWAANTALEILEGTSPEDIPVVTNKTAKIVVNMKMAKSLGIRFPIELLEDAHLIGAEEE